MKHFFFALIFFAYAAGALAQTSRRGAVEVRSADGSRITVAIDDRRYNRTGSRLVVGDLPTGRHRLCVYTVNPDSRGSGADAETVYSGVFYAERGMIVQCEVDVRKGTARMRSVETGAATTEDGARQPEGPAQAGRPTTGRQGFNATDLEDLRRRVADRITDGSKLETLQTALTGKTVPTGDLQTMTGWFSFDTTKLDFAKWAYDKASDQNTYWKMEEVFSFDSTKKEFNDFLRSRQRH